MQKKRSQTTYQWRSFAELTNAELYQLLQLRQHVFVVEQNCPYLDADGLDEYAWHLLAWRTTEKEGEQLIACLRVIYPGRKYSGPAIGRLATNVSARSQGVARELMQKALHNTAIHYPGQPVTISAQRYLENFYKSLGFVTTSEEYDEDGIPHIDMIFHH